MRVDIPAQALAFSQGMLLGAAMGLLYDGMRAVRRVLPWRWLAFLLDLAYWLAAAAGLFVLTLTFDDGKVRIFHGAAAVLGGGLYFGTIGKFFLPLLLRTADFTLAAWRFATKPARRAMYCGKKLWKKQNSLFQKWLKWFKI